MQDLGCILRESYHVWLAPAQRVLASHWAHHFASHCAGFHELGRHHLGLLGRPVEFPGEAASAPLPGAGLALGAGRPLERCLLPLTASDGEHLWTACRKYAYVHAGAHHAIKLSAQGILWKWLDGKVRTSVARRSHDGDSSQAQFHELHFNSMLQKGGIEHAHLELPLQVAPALCIGVVVISFY